MKLVQLSHINHKVNFLTEIYIWYKFNNNQITCEHMHKYKITIIDASYFRFKLIIPTVWMMNLHPPSTKLIKAVLLKDPFKSLKVPYLSFILSFIPFTML